MGEVYLAQDPRLGRKVALKIIKLGMDTKQVVARFEAERQALAMMDHPNIAKVLDAGATDAGRPFFVMELVRGIRITEQRGSVAAALRKRGFTVTGSDEPAMSGNPSSFDSSYIVMLLRVNRHQ